nr:MAG TPA: hypothetical protein [Caudoviricetes sp.]
MFLPFRYCFYRYYSVKIPSLSLTNRNGFATFVAMLNKLTLF